MRFRKSILWIMASLMNTRLLLADLTIVQELEQFDNGQPSTREFLTIYVSGKRLRCDFGQVMSSIILRDQSVTYSIWHEARQYAILRHLQKLEQKSAIGDSSTFKSVNDAIFESTVKTENISGFLCRKVLARGKDGALTELWIAENVIDRRTYPSEFQNFGEFNIIQALDNKGKNSNLNGIPVRVIRYENSKVKLRSTIRQLSAEKILASIFEVPAGYAEMKALPPTKGD